MSEVVVVVDIQAAPGRGEEVVTAFEACMVETHREPGCIVYALHRDHNDPDHLVHVERWASQGELDEHMAKPYLATLSAALRGLLTQAPKLTFASSLGLGDPAKGNL